MTDISSIPCRSAYLDQYLLDTTVDLCERYKIAKFVETGSYHGGSAKIVSRYIREVHTIENNPNLFKISQENLKNCQNVKLHFGNSAEILNEVLLEGDDNVFLFLDAHWGLYWPLMDEFRAIKQKNIKPVIAIHDFFVPPNGQFRYDVHPGDGTVLNFDYIKQSITEIYNGQYEYFYNTKCSDIDSGIIYIYPKQ